ncbi:MAG: hypothetical protein ABJC62_08375, partial [Frankiaceae bacterium]
MAAGIAFYGLNGHRLTLTNDDAYDLVMTVAGGQVDATCPRSLLPCERTVRASPKFRDLGQVVAVLTCGDDVCG